MDRSTIENKVKKALAEKFDISIEKIKPTSSLKDDLGIDSFGAIELIFEVEEKFGIDIPEQDMADARTVQDIINCIAKRVEKMA